MPSVSFVRFRAEALLVYAPPLRAKKTCAKVRQVLDEIAALGVAKTSDLTPAVVARWLKAHPDRSPCTQDSLLRSLRSACSLALASGYLKASPFAFRSRWVEASPIERACRHHTLEQLRAVLARSRSEAAVQPLEWKPRRLEALVHTYAYTGLRRNEALQLEAVDVDLGAGLIHLRHRDGRRLKTVASAAPVPIPPPLAELLAGWLPECGRWVFPGVRHTGPWTGGPPGHKPLDQVKLLGVRAGVEGLTILSFRHSFATHARRWGISELMLKAILRHTSVRTQRHYLHADPDDLRDAAGGVRI